MPEPNQSQTAASQGDDALFFSMGSSLDSDDSEDPTGGKARGKKDISQLPSFVHQKKDTPKGKTRGEGKSTSTFSCVRLTPGAHNIP